MKKYCLNHKLLLCAFCFVLYVMTVSINACAQPIPGVTHKINKIYGKGEITIFADNSASGHFIADRERADFEIRTATQEWINTDEEISTAFTQSAGFITDGSWTVKNGSFSYNFSTSDIGSEVFPAYVGNASPEWLSNYVLDIHYQTSTPKVHEIGQSVVLTYDLDVGDIMYFNGLRVGEFGLPQVWSKGYGDQFFGKYRVHKKSETHLEVRPVVKHDAAMNSWYFDPSEAGAFWFTDGTYFGDSYVGTTGGGNNHTSASNWYGGWTDGNWNTWFVIRATEAVIASVDGLDETNFQGNVTVNAFTMDVWFKSVTNGLNDTRLTYGGETIDITGINYSNRPSATYIQDIPSMDGLVTTGASVTITVNSTGIGHLQSQFDGDHTERPFQIIDNAYVHGDFLETGSMNDVANNRPNTYISFTALVAGKVIEGYVGFSGEDIIAADSWEMPYQFQMASDLDESEAASALLANSSFHESTNQEATREMQLGEFNWNVRIDQASTTVLVPSVSTTNLIGRSQVSLNVWGGTEEQQTHQQYYKVSSNGNFLQPGSSSGSDGGSASIDEESLLEKMAAREIGGSTVEQSQLLANTIFISEVATANNDAASDTLNHITNAVQIILGKTSPDHISALGLVSSDTTRAGTTAVLLNGISNANYDGEVIIVVNHGDPNGNPSRAFDWGNVEGAVGGIDFTSDTINISGISFLQHFIEIDVTPQHAAGVYTGFITQNPGTPSETVTQFSFTHVPEISVDVTSSLQPFAAEIIQAVTLSATGRGLRVAGLRTKEPIYMTNPGNYGSASDISAASGAVVLEAVLSDSDGDGLFDDIEEHLVGYYPGTEKVAFTIPNITMDISSISDVETVYPVLTNKLENGTLPGW